MIQLNSNEMRGLDRGDGTLQYAVAGDGEPVVFIHGFGLDSEMWAPQWPVFAKDYRAIRCDLRGYGRSSLPRGSYSHVDDLLALMDSLESRPAHLVGLSMGGFVGLRLAARHGDVLRSLTLLDTSPDPENPAAARQDKLLAVVYRLVGIKPVASKVSALMFGPTFRNDPQNQPIIDEFFAGIARCDRAGMRKAVLAGLK